MDGPIFIIRIYLREKIYFMYPILQHAHSGFRWLVLLAIVITVIHAIGKWNSTEAVKRDLKWGTIAVRLAHIQLLLGVVLYIISDKVQFSAQTMKNDALRFFTLEHTLMMLIAIVLLTIGLSKAKKESQPAKKFRKIFWFFIIALIIILVMIPWPFQSYSTAWF
jgi:hypothetical protein